MNLFLRRLSHSEIQTKGILFTDKNQQICNTLELPYLNNQKQISCVPAGIYDWVKRGATLKIPYLHISLLNVPNRTGIAIHKGNYASSKKSDVLGCILVGSGFKDINKDGIEDIINSGLTFDKLMKLLPDSGTITIA